MAPAARAVDEGLRRDGLLALSDERDPAVGCVLCALEGMGRADEREHAGEALLKTLRYFAPSRGEEGVADRVIARARRIMKNRRQDAARRRSVEARHAERTAAENAGP